MKILSVSFLNEEGGNKMRYLRLMLLNFQRTAEIRSRSFVWFLHSIFPAVTMVVFWGGATSGGRTIDEWTFPMLASYYLYVMVALVLTMSHIEPDVANIDIKEGGISPFLLKPFSYYWLKLFYELPYRVIQGVMGFIALGIVAFVAKDLLVFTTSLQTISLVFLMLILAFILSFTFKMIIGLLAFWITELRGLFEVVEVLIMILGGTLMPISLYPELLQQIASFLPISYVIYYPVIAMQGQLTVVESVQVIGIQILWILALGFIYRFMWRSGVKEYSAIGQ